MSKATSIAVQTEQSEPYQIIIGTDIVGALGEYLRPLLRRNKVAIVADKNALKALGEKLNAAIATANLDAVIIEAAAGEEAKNFSMLEKICGSLLENHIERDDIILSFGGGAIGDLTGLAANLVRRGVRCCHIPTTLLAQTDSAIGGKTAINSKWGKNLIGTFYPPALVLIDTSLTQSLPQRQFLCGYAEIVKYGLVGDRDFFVWLEENGAAVCAREPEALRYAVEKSCQAKAAIVSQDEKETGRRALLNFGHSFGHALESLSNYQILHGEAVSIGIVLASQLSVTLGLMAAQEAQRIAKHLHSVGLPITTDLLRTKSNCEKILALMQQDKKAKQGALVLILAKAIGDAFIYEQCSAEQLGEFLRQQELELAS